MTYGRLIQVDRGRIIAALQAHEPCKVDMTILAFIGNKSVHGQNTANEEKGR